MEQQTRWYAIHAHSGQENRVKENIENSVRKLDYGNLIEEVLIPCEEVAEIKGGKKSITTRKFFPGYVLVRMVLNDDTWYLVKNTPGVSGFIGAGRTPVPLDDEEVRGIIEREKEEQLKPKPKVMFEIGERVKITEGPFANFMGMVDELNVERGKLKVMVEIFERLTAVELEFWQVEKS